MKTQLLKSQFSSNQDLNLNEIPDIVELFTETTNFLNEIKEFAARNRVTVSLPHTHEKKDYVCSWCLKAFILSNARIFGISPKQLNEITAIFSVPTGHSGYYMDGKDIYALSSSLTNNGRFDDGI